MAPAKKPTKKSNSAEKTENNRKTEVKKYACMRKPVIVIKSVDVTDSPAKETGETSKKKEEEEEVRKEKSVEVAPASVYDEEEEEVVKMLKISSEESSDSAASSLNDKMASSSFDLATFVTSRLGSINSGSISQVGEGESPLVEV